MNLINSDISFRKKLKNSYDKIIDDEINTSMNKRILDPSNLKNDTIEKTIKNTNGITDIQRNISTYEYINNSDNIPNKILNIHPGVPSQRIKNYTELKHKKIRNSAFTEKRNLISIGFMGYGNPNNEDILISSELRNKDMTFSRKNHIIDNFTDYTFQIFGDKLPHGKNINGPQNFVRGGFISRNMD